MIKFFKHNTDKTEVTSYYIETLLEAFQDTHSVVTDISEINAGDVVVTSNMIDAFKILRKRKAAKIINWYQGIIPEEVSYKDMSFVRQRISQHLEKIIPFGAKTNGLFTSIFLLFYSCKVVYKLLSYMEKRVLERCVLNVFVSNSMLIHYNNKYRYKKDNFFIMPCYNTKIKKESFYQEGKYNSPTFAYVGGLDRWQCFEDIIYIYKEVEMLIGNSKMYIFTPDIEEAKNIVGKMKINNFTIEYVKNADLEDRLKKIKFGFLIREESPINYVATPTKMGNYLANGLVPIFSDTIGDFANIFKKLKFKIVGKSKYNKSDLAKEIAQFHENKIDQDLIFEEYNSIFSSYYNKKLYLSNLRETYKQHGVI